MKLTSWTINRWLTATAVAISFSLVFGVGCGKKEDGAAVASPPPPPIGTVLNNCTGCPGGGGFLASGIGTVITRGIQLGLNFYGDNSRINNGANGAYGYVSNYYYYGWVGASGTMTVQGTGDVCAPQGTYQIQTEQAGILSGSSIEGLRLVANGPIQMRIILKSAWLQASIPPVSGVNTGNLGLGNTTPFRLQGWMSTQPLSVQMQPMPAPGGYPYGGGGYYGGTDPMYCLYAAPYGLE